LAQWISAAPRREFLVFDAGPVHSQANRPITVGSLPSRTVEVLPDVYRESRSRTEVYEHLSPEEATSAISRWRPIDSIWFHLGQTLRLKNDMSNGFI
jgi:hypothetical protein